MSKPLAIDLFCGLGGWTEGLLAEGYSVIGFDVERHEYGELRYPGNLVLQDVRTIHGAQFKSATLIVASPPCQAYSYRAMPWKRAKALPPPDNTLFETCFRIQIEACESAGRRIPMVVENVKGAQPWVGRARWHYGSYYLWGDVPALMPLAVGGAKCPGMNWSDRSKHGQDFTRLAGEKAIKNYGGSWFNVAHNTSSGKGQNPARRRVNNDSDIKIGGGWFHDSQSELRRHSSKSPRRKMASAMIAKIPLTLSRHIGRAFYP